MAIEYADKRELADHYEDVSVTIECETLMKRVATATLFFVVRALSRTSAIRIRISVYPEFAPHPSTNSIS